MRLSGKGFFGIGVLVAGALAGWLMRRRWKRFWEHLPPEIARQLADRQLRSELLAILLRLAGYANLSGEERRLRALELVARFLAARGLHLTDPQLARLVELLSGLVRHHKKA